MRTHTPTTPGSTPNMSPHRFDLPVELLREVAKYACEDAVADSGELWGARNSTLFTLSCVNRAWGDVSNSILYHDLRIEWRARPAALLRRTLDSSADLAGRVRSITAYFTQMLDVLDSEIEDINFHTSCCHLPAWLAELEASGVGEAAVTMASTLGRTAFAEEQSYALAEERIWLSTDAQWLMRKDGPSEGTRAFFDLVAVLPSLQRLTLDQFLDPLPTPLYPALEISLGKIRSLRCIDTSNRLLDALLPALVQITDLEVEFRDSGEEGDGSDYSEDDEFPSGDDDFPSSPSTTAALSPHLQILRTGFGGGRFTSSLSTLLSTSPIETLYLGTSTTYDLATLHPASSFPAVRRLHLGGQRQQVRLASLSIPLTTAFQSLSHISLSGWNTSLLNLTSLPPLVTSIEVELCADNERPGKVGDVVKFVLDILKIKKHARHIGLVSFVDRDSALRGTTDEWARFEDIVADAGRAGVTVEVQRS